jgi:polygalacturonase
MHRPSFLVSLVLIGAVLGTRSLFAAAGRPSPDLAPAAHAPHVADIGATAITVATGSTYSFTVDTPEDKGLVVTTPTAGELVTEFALADGSAATFGVIGKSGAPKTDGPIEAGDQLVVTPANGMPAKTYALALKPLALAGQLRLEHDRVTVGTTRDITLLFTAGQRTPDATVKLFVPPGIQPTLDNTSVNVIGRGEVTLRGLPQQSIGRAGSAYSYSKVGEAAIEPTADGGAVITLQHLDLRPANGTDVKLVIHGVKLTKPGFYAFRASYTTTKPEALSSAGAGTEAAALSAVATISDFARVTDRSMPYRETATTYTTVDVTWSQDDAARVAVEQSLDEGKTWTPVAAKIEARHASIAGLAPDKKYLFRLTVAAGPHRGPSNVAAFYSGKIDVKSLGAVGDGKADDTDKINAAIAYLASLGGGTLRFTDGVYNVRTVHLASNVFLYLDAGATISALKGADAPERTWFSDHKYRSGLSPTDAGPYADPDNWLTKQDVGHQYFHNAMFVGERLDNVKIIGTGRITGAGNIVTSDSVMKNEPSNRADKMFALKLCTNLEIGGRSRPEDMWYDEQKDEPCYLAPDGSKISDISNMLHLDRGGHFVLLATGTDGINVHDTYIGKHATSNSRDIYDFMACNDVTATNIYCKMTSDDIVKPGSDCSLGFTRPAKHFRVRNIVGDTNCNLFQIGSETADDIMDACVDNIYVLGGNKAGFSISTNDGAHVKDVHLNCGETGPIRMRSKMLRAHTPFFISISNRGRVLGATVARFKFTENGKAHDELLNTNIDIGQVENIILNGVDVSEMYQGSSFRGGRWKAYDGTQAKQAPIVAGYKLPDSDVVQGGLTFKLPNGQHTGYIRHIVFNDIHFLAKGGNPAKDTDRQPPELGVGQYNASNLGVLPTYGFYGRHVQGLTVTNCSFNYEKRDSTPAMYLDDVIGAKIGGVKLVRAEDQPAAIKVIGSRGIAVENVTVFTDQWDNAPVALPAATNISADVTVK